MPSIINLKLPVESLFGELGAELFVTGHWTAGPADKSDSDAIQLCRRYHEEHADKGWGGIGYHFCITRRGTILLLRPVIMKGAHVGMHNSNNVGVMCHGTFGVKPTIRQRRAFKWLLKYAHTSKMPVSHRTDRDLREAVRKGHNDWSGHESNACPGTFKRMYRSGGTAR